jgi:hypothetical protein
MLLVPPLLPLLVLLLLLSTRGLTGAGASAGTDGTLLLSTAAKLSGAAADGLAGAAAGASAGPAAAVTFGTCSRSTALAKSAQLYAAIRLLLQCSYTAVVMQAQGL